jgi:hypothetical protein
MIEAIFGAEESDGHNQSEYKVSDKSKSGKVLAIGWNLKVFKRTAIGKQPGNQCCTHDT